MDPTTPWLEYINTILSKDLVQVTADEIIIVDSPSYIQQMSALLRVTSARVQANYLLWRVAASV